MKTLKVIIGFLLLIGTGIEYSNASTQLGTMYSPGIIIAVLLMLFFSTWLIGSGFTVRKFRIKSFEFLKFFIISIITVATVVIFNFGSKAVPSHLIEINGLTIPLRKCIDGNKKIMPDENERKEYCNCVVEKIANDSDLKLEYQEKLEMGEVIEIIKNIQGSSKFKELGIEECILSIRLEWTDEIASSMKKNWMKQLSGTEFEETNNIEKYCNCILFEYRKFPINEVMDDKFGDSKEAKKIDEKCSNQSLIE